MSEEPQNEIPAFNLNVNGGTYDLNVLVHALSFAHDYSAAEDIRNAAKNCAEPRLSPLTMKIEQSLEMLQEIRVRGQQAQGNPDDPSAADA